MQIIILFISDNYYSLFYNSQVIDYIHIIKFIFRVWNLKKKNSSDFFLFLILDYKYYNILRK